MKLSEFVTGVGILAQYYNNPNGFHVGAEHDQFYMWATDKLVTPEDFAALRELGWFQPDSFGDDYDPELSWSCYT